MSPPVQETSRGSPVLLLHCDPHWRTLLLLDRRLLVEAEPGDGLELVRQRSLRLVVTVPGRVLHLPDPGAGHPPVALVVGGGGGNLQPGHLPSRGRGGTSGAGGAGGLLEDWTVLGLEEAGADGRREPRRGGVGRHRGDGGGGGGEGGEPPGEGDGSLAPPVGVEILTRSRVGTLLHTRRQGGGFGSSRLWQRLWK